MESLINLTDQQITALTEKEADELYMSCLEERNKIEHLGERERYLNHMSKEEKEQVADIDMLMNRINHLKLHRHYIQAY